MKGPKGKGKSTYLERLRSGSFENLPMPPLGKPSVRQMSTPSECYSVPMTPNSNRQQSDLDLTSLAERRGKSTSTIPLYVYTPAMYIHVHMYACTMYAQCMYMCMCMNVCIFHFVYIRYMYAHAHVYTSTVYVHEYNINSSCPHICKQLYVALLRCVWISAACSEKVVDQYMYTCYYSHLHTTRVHVCTYT